MRTPLEVDLKSILETWGMLFEDGMHIDREFRPYFKNELKRTSNTDLEFIHSIAFSLLADITYVLQKESEIPGQLDDNLAMILGMCTQDMIEVSEMISEECALRIQ